ncbi:hypothetical protein ACFL5F_05025 [Planctomycetota bacterium]
MKITIILFIIAAIMFLVTGCGPGEPFEIEGMHTPQSTAPTQLLAAR